MDDKHLEELFALPIGLELEATVDGEKYYSSQKLRESFLKSMGSAGRATKIYNQINTLVMKKKLIVPCYMSKNMLRFFKHKFWGADQDKTIMGFYHMKQKRVFIVIDNNTSIVGTAKNDLIASTTMHECVHLYSDRMRGKFLNLFKPELERYYISFFSRLFRLNRKPNLNEFLKFVSVFEYQRAEQMNKQLTSYYKILEKALKPHTELNDTDFIKVLTKMVVMIKYSLTNFPGFVRMYRNFVDINGPLDRAYLDAFGKRNVYTSPYQELSSISEVICILTELRPTYPKIKKMFSDMA
jgi:preprotein translocase subunit Sss1